jgi:predicted DNA-binding transcriptional regulator AlpA
MANKRLPASFRRDLTIRGFCKKHRIGRSTYYDLQKRDLGPEELRIGRVVRITPEADDEWVKRMRAQASGSVPKFAPKHQAGGKEDDGADKAPKRKRHSKKPRAGSRERHHHAHYW